MTDVEDQLLIRGDDWALATDDDDCLQLASVTSDDNDCDNAVRMRLSWLQYLYSDEQQLLQLTPSVDTGSSSAHSDDSLQVS